jgi:hypothetical protein
LRRSARAMPGPHESDMVYSSCAACKTTGTG